MEKSWNDYRRETFFVDGMEATLVFPDKADKDGNWALKTEYRDAFPHTEIELLKKGFHIAFLKNRNRFATKADCDSKAKLVHHLKENYGLCGKCYLVGMSLGGAHAVNFGGDYPQLVKGIFLDAPVLSFHSFPGKLGDKVCEEVWENEFKIAYPGVSRADLFTFDRHPINKIPVLKEHKIPVFLMYGTEDMTVDYNENGAIMELAYADSPELLKVVPRQYQGHHPHGFLDSCQELFEFFNIQ